MALPPTDSCETAAGADGSIAALLLIGDTELNFFYFTHTLHEYPLDQN